MLTYEEVKKNPAVNTYISAADESLKTIGYTEHSFAHTGLVASRAEYILSVLGYGKRELELVKIAALLHDIGNLVNRTEHAQSGAVMAFRILDNMNMPPEDIAVVVTAIGNHDEGTGVPVSPVSAALILADKSDVRRNRVRNSDKSRFDIHDRVNYSVEESNLTVNTENKTVLLELKVDTEYGSVMDYFEIFLNRMVLCRKAAERLDLRFKLCINGHQLI